MPSAVRRISPAELAAFIERVRRRVIRWFRLADLLDGAFAAHVKAPIRARNSVGANGRHVAVLTVPVHATAGRSTLIGSRIGFRALAGQMSLRRMLDCYQQRFGVADTSRLLASLCYFDGAEAEPMPTMLVPLSWETVKREVRAMVRQIAD